MAFEWDPEKAEANRRKHGVDFADAVGAFGDPFALTQEDPHQTE
ncbi:MAG: BrnT family toxin [Armatimonadetes bacterium]|nr:BrnT family toxin [Armatimonadota bacterium]